MDAGARRRRLDQMRLAAIHLSKSCFGTSREALLRCRPDSRGSGRPNALRSLRPGYPALADPLRRLWSYQDRAVSLHGLASGWENQALYLRAVTFAFGSVVSLAINSAHAAGPTQAELNNATNESTGRTWITTIVANATRRSTRSPRRTPAISPRSAATPSWTRSPRRPHPLFTMACSMRLPLTTPSRSTVRAAKWSGSPNGSHGTARRSSPSAAPP
jgi:hypothetical protein